MHVKLFVGTRLTPEMKTELGHDFSPIICIPYKGKEYIGYYLTSDYPTVQQIRACRNRFILKLQEHCPKRRIDNLPVVVFPQLFVG